MLLAMREKIHAMKGEIEAEITLSPQQQAALDEKIEVRPLTFTEKLTCCWTELAKISEAAVNPQGPRK